MEQFLTERNLVIAGLVVSLLASTFSLLQSRLALKKADHAIEIEKSKIAVEAMITLRENIGTLKKNLSSIRKEIAQNGFETSSDPNASTIVRFYDWSEEVVKEISDNEGLIGQKLADVFISLRRAHSHLQSNAATIDGDAFAAHIKNIENFVDEVESYLRCQIDEKRQFIFTPMH